VEPPTSVVAAEPAPPVAYSVPDLGATVVTDQAPGLLGQVIDNKYEITSSIGEGGMAVVYLARHRQMERDVVIKVMHAWLMSRNNSLERFEREYKVTARLNHPNVVAIFDVGTHGKREPYIVMEYVKGQTLADLIETEGALPLNTVAKIAIQICRGLEEAHSVGIIHRDLKPENILLHANEERPDWVKIADFGIAHLMEAGKRLTHTGKLVGTPEYMSPEQLRDKPVDARSDMYALGVMMFEMITGRVPFTGESAEPIMMKHLLEDAPSVHSVRKEIAEDSPFARMVRICMEKSPESRFPSIKALRLELEKAQKALP
jgi:serine/threonine-protein kinase